MHIGQISIRHSGNPSIQQNWMVALCHTVTRALHVQDMRELNITPHVASKKKGTAIDGRTTRHASYRQSLKDRKKIEEFFGWAKVIAGFRKLRHTGLEKIKFYFSLAAGCFNLVKLRNLIAQT